MYVYMNLLHYAGHSFRFATARDSGDVLHPFSYIFFLPLQLAYTGGYQSHQDMALGGSEAGSVCGDWQDDSVLSSLCLVLIPYGLPNESKDIRNPSFHLKNIQATRTCHGTHSQYSLRPHGDQSRNLSVKACRRTCLSLRPVSYYSYYCVQ